MRAWLEKSVQSAWYGGARWWVVLLPLSWIVRAVAYYRRVRFISRPPASLGIPVVVVGGITAGGTGKTQVLVALAVALQGWGMRVAVVSRGYGGAVHRIPKLVDASQDSAEVVGDESLMLARGLGAPVVVCTDRQAAVAAVRDWQLADVVLADDGLQHYRMARVFEIAVLDGERGVGNGRLLPAGPLREPVSRLDSVDWRLERNGSCRDSAFRYTVIGLHSLQTGECVTLDEARDAWAQWSICAVTGLGQPEQFFSMLARTGLTFQQRALADHAALTPKVLAAIDADIVLVTAKDAIKIPAEIDPRIWVVEITTQLPGALIDTLHARLREDN